MATPRLVTVRGTYLKLDGTPETGTVNFRSQVFTLHGEGATVVAPGSVDVTLDNTGSFSVQLPSTDDPDWSPVGWTYEITVRLSDSYYVFNTTLPYDIQDGILDVSELTPVASGGGTLYAAIAHDHPEYISAATATSLLSGVFAPVSHTHAASAIVSGTIAIARLPIGTGAGQIAAGDHTHNYDSIYAAVNHTHNQYATSANPTFSGTVSGITKSMVGLGNVDNTSDLNKPLSTAIANALALKADLVDGKVPEDQLPEMSSAVASVAGKTGEVTLDKTDVGLGNVDNTSDANKPVSTAQQTAISNGDAAVLYTAALAYDASVAATAALANKVSKTGDTMTGDLTIRGSDKGYRLRPTGGALDFEFGGAELWLAGKSGSEGDPFGGDQYVVLKLRPNQALVTAVGVWEYTDGPYGGARHLIDGTNGVASLGSKNGLTNLRFCGYKDSPGAPTTGNWATGDLVLDSNKTWWRCSAGGEPGTWA